MKLLVVVDMQNDFIDGALGTPEAQAIVPNVVEKIKQYIDMGEHIIYTRDTHYDDYLNTQEGKKLPVPHCIINTEGWQVKEEIARPYGKITFAKDHFINKTSFGLYNFRDVIGDLLYYQPIESIELVGLCTDICVISNTMILKAAFPEVPITVDASCCAGVTPQSHKNALEAMKMCQINIIGE